jgi:hypothetical protein
MHCAHGIYVAALIDIQFVSIYKTWGCFVEDLVQCVSCTEFSLCGGSGEIRTHGPFRVAGFQDRCNRPLCHASLLAILAPP